MNTLKNIVLASAAIGALLTTTTSCKKTYSSDDPLPSVYESSVYVATTTTRKVYAVNPANGNKRWEAKVDNEVLATPVLYNNKLYVIDAQGLLYKINPINGKIEDKKALGGAVSGTPIVYSNTLIIPIRDSVKAIEVENNYNIKWRYGAGANITTSPTINTIDTSNTKMVFFSVGSKVISLKADNGQQNWSVTVAGAGMFNTSVCVANHNYLYVGSDDGALYALQLKTGGTYWKYQTGAAIKSSPISIGGNVIVGSDDRNIYSVDSATGLLRWKYVTQDRIQSSPVVFNQNIYFGSNDYNVYAINIIDGTLKWKSLTFGPLIASPIAHNGRVYINSFDNNVYSFDAETGAQKWAYNTNGIMKASMILDTIGGSVVPSISGSYRY